MAVQLMAMTMMKGGYQLSTITRVPVSAPDLISSDWIPLSRQRFLALHTSGPKFKVTSHTQINLELRADKNFDLLFVTL